MYFFLQALRSQQDVPHLTRIEPADDSFHGVKPVRPTNRYWDSLEEWVPQFEVMAQRLELQDTPSSDFLEIHKKPSLPPILRRLLIVLKRFQANWPRVEADWTSTSPVMLDTAWSVLSTACLNADDGTAAETVLALMKLSGMPPSNQQCDGILKFFAVRGCIKEADAHVARFGSDRPREWQRYMLINARLQALKVNEACDLLYTYEQQGFFPSMETYVKIIRAILFSEPRNTTKAWKVFTSMRDIAHHTPNATCYHMMLRRGRREPEDALNLFHEMTVERGIMPDSDAYTAVICSCARSEEFASHAIRFTRELLGAHREALGDARVRLTPRYRTFSAAMEAAARIGDLSLALSVLDMMEQHARDTGSASQSDTRIALQYLFRVYSWYVPPSATTVSADLENALSPSQSSLKASAETQEDSNLPQSHEDVVRDATLIWESVTAPLWKPVTANHIMSIPSLVYLRVPPNELMLNAFMWVHYNHSPPSESFKVYTDVLNSTGLRPQAYTLIYALEAYANYKCDDVMEALSILPFARAMWNHWQSLKSSRVQYSDGPISSEWNSRVAARAYAAMIRNLIKAGNSQEAVDILRSFVILYPPDSQPASLKEDSYKPEHRRPEDSMSLVSTQQSKPLLGFRDLVGLYNFARKTGDRLLFEYVSWVVDAYESRSSSKVRPAYLRKFRQHAI